MKIAGLSVLTAEPPAHQPIRERPILFIHGMWEGAWAWQNYLDYFAAQGYACYALNLRGHYDSRPVTHFGRCSLNDYLSDARMVARALGDPIIIGHSMGGLLAQKIAEVDDPPAVVCVAPAGPRGIFAASGNMKELLKESAQYLPAALLQLPMPPGKEATLRLAFNRLPAEDHDRVYAALTPESGRQAFDLMLAGYPVDASKVTAPMLVIGGSDDRLTPMPMVHKIVERYHAEFHEYRGHGHMILFEPGWERPAGDIAAWLDRTAGTGTVPAQQPVGTAAP